MITQGLGAPTPVSKIDFQLNRTQNTNMNTIIESLSIDKETTPEIDTGLIEIVVSEVDRQTAARYMDNDNCLVCTTLRNRGFNLMYAGGHYVRMENGDFWDLESDGGAEEHALNSKVAPYFGVEVVGQIIRLRKDSIWD